jgi:DNA-binding transcriptional ArsR family regulator
MPDSNRPSDDLERLAAARRERDEFFARVRLNQFNFFEPDPRNSAEKPATGRLNVAPLPPALNRRVERRLDATFHALGDPTRRGMLAALSGGEKSIGELAEPYAMSFAGAAKHVKVLEAAGLLVRRRSGRRQLCRLTAGALAGAGRLLLGWEQRAAAQQDAVAAGDQ